MMTFKPLTEKEANTGLLLPPGDYDFEIVGAEETFSKNTGLGMFALELRVISDAGEERKIRDYVMTEGKAAFRLRQLCEACGLLEAYERGELSGFDFERRTGRVKLGVEKSEEYGDKNRVKAYLVPSQNGAASMPPPRPRQEALPAAASAMDDEIPF